MGIEVIDFESCNTSQQRLDLISFLSDIIQRITEGDLQEVDEIMIVWTNENGQVEYDIPSYMCESDVIQLTAPIFVEMSYNLSADRYDSEEEA